MIYMFYSIVFIKSETFNNSITCLKVLKLHLLGLNPKLAKIESHHFHSLTKEKTIVHVHICIILKQQNHATFSLPCDHFY